MKLKEKFFLSLILTKKFDFFFIKPIELLLKIKFFKRQKKSQQKSILKKIL